MRNDPHPTPSRPVNDRPMIAPRPEAPQSQSRSAPAAPSDEEIKPIITDWASI